jgi:hypothetical protein
VHFFRNAPAGETTARVTIRNETHKPLLLIFEPWCWTDELAAGAERVCEGTSPYPGWLEVETSADAVTVWAWDACVGRVLDREGRVITTLDIRVPDFTALDRETRGDPGGAAD